MDFDNFDLDQEVRVLMPSLDELHAALTKRYEALVQPLELAMEMWSRYDTLMERGLRCGPVSNPSECTEAAKELVENYSELSKQMAPLKKNIHKSLVSLQQRYKAYVRTDKKVNDLRGLLSGAIQFMADPPMLPRLEWKTENRHLEELERLFENTYPNMAYPYLEEQLWIDHRQLQLQLRNIVQTQPQKIQHELLERFSPVTSVPHKLETRPVVNVDVHKRVDLSNISQQQYIPVEVMELIFECADIESCVILRQVNSAWYGAFQACQGVLKTKVLERTLVLEPGEDGTELYTWGDCVLVFSGRLKNKKWTVDKDYSLEGRILSSRQTLVSEDTTSVLPSDFTPIVSGQSQSAIDAKYHIQHFDLDPRTLKFIRTGPIPETDMVGHFNTTRHEDVHVEVRGCDLVFPAHISPHFFWIIFNNDVFVAVVGRRNEFLYFLPRESPDYRLGRGFEVTLDPRREKFVPNPHQHHYDGSSFLIEREEGEDNRSRHYTYWVIDMRHKRLVKLFTSRLPVPNGMGLLNGLFWRTVDRNSSAILPSFVDLSTDVCYHRKDWAIHTQAGTKWTQTIVNGVSGRFMYRVHPSHSLELVDLVTRAVIIAESCDDLARRFLPGFSNGRLAVWSWTSDTTADFILRLRKLKIETPDQPEYDVSERMEQSGDSE